MPRRTLLAFLAMILIGGGLWIVGLLNARAMPIVRSAAIGLAGWPAEAPPVRAVLLSDIHIGNLTMDRSRLDRIVAQVSALRPDIVLIAGDFVEGNDPLRAADRTGMIAASFAMLRPRLGIVAVLGNHDYWSGAGAIAAALRSGGITVLDNGVAIRGPLLIGGIGDAFSGHDRPAEVLERMAGSRGGRLILSHSPDVTAAIGDRVSLVLAGHTHCGQVIVPLIGGISVSRFGNRYRCGIMHDGDRTTIVTAGLGTNSVVPLRFGAPPDLWLLTLGPAGEGR